MTDITPTSEAIDSRTREALVSFGVDADAITRDADLKSLDVDSLDVVELCHILRTELGIDVEARDLLEVRTYGDLVDTVGARPRV
jgi:acyl carrier protein